LCKVKKTIGRFQLEAPGAYNCKQILGLCQCLISFKNICFKYTNTTEHDKVYIKYSNAGQTKISQFFK